MIKITDKYYIEADSMQFIVGPGSEEGKFHGMYYYRGLEDAILSIYRITLRERLESEAETLTDVVRVVRQTTDEFTAALKAAKATAEENEDAESEESEAAA